MKITNNQLKKMIKEELESTIGVQEGEMRVLGRSMEQLAQDALAALQAAESQASSQAFDKSMGPKGSKSLKLRSAIEQASRILQDAMGEYHTTYLQE